MVNDPVLYTSKKGYKVIAHCYEGETVSCRAHRLAGVAWFGYDEIVGKEVHHHNKHPSDNREENCIPLTSSEHSRIHAREQFANEDGEAPWRNKAALENYYVDEELTIDEVAEKLDATYSKVWYWLDEYGIERRNRGSTKTSFKGTEEEKMEIIEECSAGYEKPWREKEILEYLYCEKRMTLNDIGDGLGVTAPTIAKWLERCGIERRDPCDR